MSKVIKLKTTYIELGQFLKLINLISTGGHAKSYLAENDVLVNGVVEKRRGRKLYTGDTVAISGESFEIQSSDLD